MVHVRRFDSYLEYWDFFYPAACVNGWKIIFLLYSSGSKFTITSLLSKWVYLNYFLDVFKKAQTLGRFTAVFLTFALSSLLHVSKRRIIHVPVWVSTIKNNLAISKWFFVYLSRANYLIHNNSCYNVNIN